jgi:hypothetical protein
MQAFALRCLLTYVVLSSIPTLVHGTDTLSSGLPVEERAANETAFFFEPDDWKVIYPDATRHDLTVDKDTHAVAADRSAFGGSLEASDVPVEELMRLSGTYFDSQNPGDGFDFMVVRQSSADPAIDGTPAIVVFFYGYDVDGSRLWLISDLIMPTSATSFSNQTMFISSGSGFSGAGDSQLVEWGQLDFESTVCGSATFTLTPNGRSSKVMNASQLIDIPGPGCQLPAPRAFQSIAGLSGSWYRMAEPGDGLNVHVANAGLVAFFYGYDSQGDPMWLLTSEPYRGPILPGVELTFNMVKGSGGDLYSVNGASLSNWGTLSLTFQDCTSAEATLIGTDGTKSFSIVQLAKVAGAVCDAPGTVELSQDSLTFEEQGDKLSVDTTVRNANGDAVSTSMLEISIQNQSIAKVNSFNAGSAEIEAATNTTSTTKATFWDPVVNAVQEAEINIVDFQPNTIVIPRADVVSGQTPTKNQVNEIVLVRNALTESLVANKFIWTMGNSLYGEVDSIQIETNTVRIQLSFASLPKVILNMRLSAQSMISSSNTSWRPQGPGQLVSSGNTFTVEQGRSRIENVECSIDGDPISVGSFTADVVINQPSGVVNRFYEISNGVPSSNSNISASITLSGEMDIGLPSSAPFNSNIHCDIMDEFLLTPGTPLWAPYSGGVLFPVNVAVDFNLHDQPPDPLMNFEWGVIIDFDYQLASEDLSMSVKPGLAGNRFVEMGFRALANAPAGGQITVTPTIDGPLCLFGEGDRSEFEAMVFIPTTIDFPYAMDFEGPGNVFDSAYRGPVHSLSLGASGLQQVDASAALLDPLGFGSPDLPVMPIFSPADETMLGSPELELSANSCGSHCEVGDPRHFDMVLNRPGFSDFSLTGEVVIYARVNGETLYELGSFTKTGQAPLNAGFSFPPNEAGFWEILPRFESSDDGATYGGPSATIEVEGQAETCTLNVNVIGNGDVSSDPAGINCGNDCTHGYNLGQEILLSGTADEGWFLNGWSDNCNTNEDNSCSVVMECDQSVTAEFVEFIGAEGDPRANLVWHNTDDLDLHCIDPCEHHIYWSHRFDSCGDRFGELDTDANAVSTTTSPVENIAWPDGGASGVYECWVHNFASRNDSAAYTLRLQYAGREEVYSGSLAHGEESAHRFFTKP